jgi:hypothetical protein
MRPGQPAAGYGVKHIWEGKKKGCAVEAAPRLTMCRCSWRISLSWAQSFTMIPRILERR